MANNTEQDKMDVLIRELYTLSAQDIEPHHFAVKARQLIEAEATRRVYRFADSIYGDVTGAFLLNENPHTSALLKDTEAVLNAELKRQAKGGK